MTATEPLGLILIGFAGMVASAINAIAGGGSLISFPLLVALGVPTIQANATNSSALWPGSLSSAFGFRDQLAACGQSLWRLMPPTVLGALLGSLILLSTPARVFDLAVPVLIAFATLLLAFQPRIKRWAIAGERTIQPGWGAFLQFLVALYGGYFGAGMGILMLAYLGLMLRGNLHEQNAVKAWLGVAINFFATAFFAWNGLILWPVAAAMAVGSVVGGYAAARISLKADPERLRRGIVVIGAVMVVWFTYRTLGVASSG